MRRRNQALILAVILGTLASNRADAGPLDPNQFASLGTLNLTSGSYAFIVGSTGAPTLAQLSGINFTTLYTGTYSNGIAVFDFNSVSIASGVNIASYNSGGGGPIALLSKSSEIINGSISVSGGNGAPAPYVGDMSYSIEGPGAGGGTSGGVAIRLSFLPAAARSLSPRQAGVAVSPGRARTLATVRLSLVVVLPHN